MKENFDYDCSFKDLVYSPSKIMFISKDHVYSNSSTMVQYECNCCIEIDCHCETAVQGQQKSAEHWYKIDNERSYQSIGIRNSKGISITVIFTYKYEFIFITRKYNNAISKKTHMSIQLLVILQQYGVRQSVLQLYSNYGDYKTRLQRISLRESIVIFYSVSFLCHNPYERQRKKN